MCCWTSGHRVHWFATRAISTPVGRKSGDSIGGKGDTLHYFPAPSTVKSLAISAFTSPEAKTMYVMAVPFPLSNTQDWKLPSTDTLWDVLLNFCFTGGDNTDLPAILGLLDSSLLSKEEPSLIYV